MKRQRKAKATHTSGFSPSSIKVLPAVLNLSGIRATEFNVVVQPAKVDDIIKMKGPNGETIDFRKPIEHVEKHQAAAVEGVIVHVSPLAFSYERWPEDGEPKPKVGDRVLYAKYSGMKRTGKDGQDYLIIKDKDICAVVD